MSRLPTLCTTIASRYEALDVTHAEVAEALDVAAEAAASRMRTTGAAMIALLASKDAGEEDGNPPRPIRPCAHRDAKRYLVTVCVEQCWNTVVLADDPDAAQDQALALWDEQAPVAFKEAGILRVDVIDAEELP